ncbi:MAG: cytochrome-c oxidase, cbb3-type subunit I, partial [Alphaproteobacteria bacterium]|nr:cytochrome-c oxidase, cbb3-type subunit I [Alphaproteobacteria bacterium]
MRAVWSGLLVAGAAIGIVAAARSPDPAMAVHGIVLAAFCIAGLFVVVKLAADAAEGHPAVPSAGYDEAIVRAGVVASVFWGLAGFLVGVVLAFQLAFPVLNFDTALLNFGRLRPIHTSAVIFAFGGNVLITTSFHVVQRTCRARLWGGSLAWFVFWGHQLFIVLAATGYLLGVTQSKEYAEPEWYVDLWLTIVWVAYFAVFMGTIMRRREPHIYVTNWFYIAFIVTIAMLHIVNNLAIPVS